MTGARDGIIDAHFHVIDPRFPLIPNQGYLPEPFTVTDYRDRSKRLGITGGVVVSGSFQGSDQGYLLDALHQLGPGFAGVTHLPPDTPAERILELDRAGVSAVRVNLYRGGPADAQLLDRMARRVHEIAGWHTELYLDATSLPELSPLLNRLPQVAIDHLAMSDDDSGILLDLVADGAVVKATGLGRVGVSSPTRLMRAIVDVNPGGLVFGSDLPSTRARVPFRDEDVDVIAEAVGEDNIPRVFRENARRLYRIGENERT